MDIDVDWFCVGGSFIGFCLFSYFQNYSQKKLQHFQNARPIIYESKRKEGDLVSVDLGTIDKNNSFKSTGTNQLIVARQLNVTEHKTVFNPAVRLWLDSRNVLSTQFSSVPFDIKSVDKNNKQFKLCINCVDPSVFKNVLSTLDSKIDHAKPSGITVNLLDFFAGERTKAYETTEKGLLVGSRVTAIGFLSRKVTGGLLGSTTQWILSGDPSGVGFKLILSPSSMQELILFETKKNQYLKMGIFLSAMLGLFFMTKKSRTYLWEQLERYRFRRTLDQLMTSRRAENSQNNEEGRNTTSSSSEGNTNSSHEDEHLCVICLSNERQTFFVPCGHVCACQECASALASTALGVSRCPICRAVFTRFSNLLYP